MIDDIGKKRRKLVRNNDGFFGKDTVGKGHQQGQLHAFKKAGDKHGNDRPGEYDLVIFEKTQQPKIILHDFGLTSRLYLFRIKPKSPSTREASFSRTIPASSKLRK